MKKNTGHNNLRIQYTIMIVKIYPILLNFIIFHSPQFSHGRQLLLDYSMTFDEGSIIVSNDDDSSNSNNAGIAGANSYLDGDINYDYDIPTETADMPMRTSVLEPSGQGGCDFEVDKSFIDSICHTAINPFDYWSKLKVAVDIHTGNITENPKLFSYAEDMTAANITFCVRTDIGSVYYWNTTASEGSDRALQEEGELVESSISYSIVKFKLLVDLAVGFSTAAVSVEELDTISQIESTDLATELSVCECELPSKVCTSSQVYSQNSLLNLCITSPPNTVITDVNSVLLDLVGKAMQVQAVSPSTGPNAITNIGGLDTDIVYVTTRFISAFFDDTASFNNVEISGLVTLGFSSGRRVLVKTGPTHSSRILEDDVNGLGSFSLDIELGENVASGVLSVRHMMTKGLLATIVPIIGMII